MPDPNAAPNKFDYYTMATEAQKGIQAYEAARLVLARLEQQYRAGVYEFYPPEGYLFCASSYHEEDLELGQYVPPNPHHGEFMPGVGFGPIEPMHTNLPFYGDLLGVDSANSMFVADQETGQACLMSNPLLNLSLAQINPSVE